MTAQPKKPRPSDIPRVPRRAKYLRIRPDLARDDILAALGFWNALTAETFIVRVVDDAPRSEPRREPLRMPTAHEARHDPGTLLDTAHAPDGSAGDGDADFVWLNEAGKLPPDLCWRDLSDDGWLRE